LITCTRELRNEYSLSGASKGCSVNNVVITSATQGVSRAVARAETAVRFLCMERTPGRFSREIQLFWPVNSHEGRAVLGGGLLTVEFPKIEDKRQAAHSLHIEERFEPAGPEPRTTDRKEGSR